MSSTLRATMARAIRAERQRAGLSQTAFGARMNWSRKIVSRIENEEQPVPSDLWPEVCRVLDVTLLQLLDRASEKDRRDLGL